MSQGLRKFNDLAGIISAVVANIFPRKSLTGRDPDSSRPLFEGDLKSGKSRERLRGLRPLESRFPTVNYRLPCTHSGIEPAQSHRL